MEINMQSWHEYITNLQRRFDEDMGDNVIVNGISASVNNNNTLTKIIAHYDSLTKRLVVSGNCDDAMYRIPAKDGQRPVEYWAELRDVDADYLAKKITTGEAREWYPEKYKAVFRERFAEKGEQFAKHHVDGVEVYEEAVYRWKVSDHIFYDDSPWDMGLAPHMKVYMHAAALRAIGRRAQRSIDVRAQYAKPS